jgi:hypothetical protein
MSVAENTPDDAREHLSRVARAHIAESGYRVSLPGRIYLSFLLRKGARRVARRPERMYEAEKNLRLLLDQAAGETGVSVAADEPGGSPLASA